MNERKKMERERNGANQRERERERESEQTSYTSLPSSCIIVQHSQQYNDLDM